MTYMLIDEVEICPAWQDDDGDGDGRQSISTSVGIGTLFLLYMLL
jgi:hypothetical protein